MPERVLIKWVKKAGQWCKTSFFTEQKTNKLIQKQEWFDSEEDAKNAKPLKI